jgi:CheY-like chemotaxis protein
LGSGETVLIVEDDPDLREMAFKTLSSLGYEALTAADGQSALEIFDKGTSIDVLFTDVVLPKGMNGVALAELVQARQPSVKVLYTSGYTENAVVHNGKLDEGLELLEKPYRRADVARRLRKLLEI